MIFLTSVLVTLLAHSTVAASSKTVCSIDPMVSLNSPLVIYGDNEEFLYPRPGESTLEFEKGETVNFFCPGSKLIIKGSETQEVVEATCIAKLGFKIFGKRVRFNQVSCSGVAVTESRITERSCANDTGFEAEIGFPLPDGRFLTTIVVCFDPVSQTPIWSYYNITASIGSKISNNPRPYFVQDKGFYNLGSKTVNKLYGRTTQRATINGLIGLGKTDTKYIKRDASYFLSRGHLAARADFFYPSQQNSTFRYINAAPQFQTFNGGNWNRFEVAVRDYVEDNEVDLQVWTGIYGMTTLPHETTEDDIGLALYVDSKSNIGLPVPELFWKVIYDSVTKRGIALLGINNPYQEDVDKSLICDDVSKNVTWLTFDKQMQQVTEGYSYACSISNFRKAVKTVPDLIVTDLLM